MSIKNYVQHAGTQQTQQTVAVPGKNQVQNNAGGFVFQVSDKTALERFLILGTEGGTYYASEKDHTLKSVAVVSRMLQQGKGKEVVDTIVEVSDAGRAPKNDPAIFALAMCLKQGDLETKRYASAAVPKVCRIGTHIFSLAEAVKSLGGWGRRTQTAFTNWYLGQTPDQLGMNLAKYQSRGGWSHRDLLLKLNMPRKVKPGPETDAHRLMVRWAVGSELNEADAQAAKTLLPKVIRGMELAKGEKSAKVIVRLIEEYGLPRECVPTEHLNSVEVWDALLRSGKGMPMTAMVRNLGKMTEVGLIKPMSSASKYIVGRLEDGAELKRARIHPISLLMAQSIYRQGRGLKGSLTWMVDQNIADALDEAFYKAFGFVEPTGKRFLLGLDVSGSMGSGYIAGTALTPREGSAAMSMLAARTEKWHHIVGFTADGGGYWNSGTAIRELDIGPKMTLPEAVRRISDIPFGSTDCSLPMTYALQKKLEVDVFVVYTDNETYAGRIHPFQALKQYRQATGINAKLIVVGMTATQFSIADPSDAGMLDVVGFDTNVPQLMADFVR